MLKTALKPRWIAALVLALALSTVFVLLSQWQFSASQSKPPPPPGETESVKPLTDVFKPGIPMMAATADQMVSVHGNFVPGAQVLVQDRLQDGDNGLWVVDAFAVDGVQQFREDVVIPVVRGWIKDPADAVPAPEGEASVVGRLLPTEGPVPGARPAGQIATLSVAELINRWDAPSYSGFVIGTGFTVAGKDLGTATEGTAMQPVVVGPQPQEAPVNWMNVFYAVEWVVFAGFAIFLWWRLVADDYRRDVEDAEDAAAAARSAADAERGGAAGPAEPHPADQGGADQTTPRNTPHATR
ncbi:SURF1 family cytochrome oxidase biogenesis protein [Arthrobacter sp.]|uniref:SURF1 family protein n=1 Tax=Arthrobacter sp. TaxID=1667 RepID=UPI0033997CBA